MKTVDFVIKSRPYEIAFECPYCGCDVEISWSNANPPDCWSNYWGYRRCPDCLKIIELGEWEYD